VHVGRCCTSLSGMCSLLMFFQALLLAKSMPCQAPRKSLLSLPKLYQVRSVFPFLCFTFVVYSDLFIYLFFWVADVPALMQLQIEYIVGACILIASIYQFFCVLYPMVAIRVACNVFIISRTFCHQG
jgi:hypothetical protein